MRKDPASIHGRGATENPANRFETLSYVPDQDWTDPEDPAPPDPIHERSLPVAHHV